MSSYSTAKIVYKKGLQAVLTNLKRDYYEQIHGSLIHDLVIDAYPGIFVDSDRTEKIIRGLVEKEVLQPLQCAPNTSQRAFTGLQYSSSGYKHAISDFNTAYGLQTHFWFKVNTDKLEKIIEDLTH